MSKGNIQKSGEIADTSGIYGIVGPRGGHTGIERTVVKGEPLPPVLEPGQGFVLLDPTNTDGKR